MTPAIPIGIAVGAAAGALLRWLLGLGLNRLLPLLPIGTLVANWIGALLAGIAMALFVDGNTVSPATRLALTTGFLGGLTTFSAFSMETVELIVRGEWGWTAAIIASHVIGSLLLTLIGLFATRWLMQGWA